MDASACPRPLPVLEAAVVVAESMRSPCRTAAAAVVVVAAAGKDEPLATAAAAAVVTRNNRNSQILSKFRVNLSQKNPLQ